MTGIGGAWWFIAALAVYLVLLCLFLNWPVIGRRLHTLLHPWQAGYRAGWAAARADEAQTLAAIAHADRAMRAVMQQMADRQAAEWAATTESLPDLRGRS